MTVAQALRTYAKSPHLAAATRSNYLTSAHHLEALAPEITDLQPEQLQAYLSHRGGFASPRTVRGELAAARIAISNEGHWHRFAGKMRTAKPKPGPGQALTKGQAALLITIAASKPEWKNVHDLIAIALNTGMRSGELRDLELRNVDLDRNVVTIRSSKSGARAVPLNTDAAQIFRERIARLPAGAAHDTRLFSTSRNPKGNPWHQTWNRIRTEAGMKHIRFHDLRHTAITLMSAAGIGEAAIREIVGHLDPAMSRLYTHPHEEHLRRAVQVLQGRPPGVSRENAATPPLPPKQPEETRNVAPGSTAEDSPIAQHQRKTRTRRIYATGNVEAHEARCCCNDCNSRYVRKLLNER